MNFSSQDLFILRSILLLIWGILYTSLQKYGSHILSFLADSRWMLVATLRLINRWKACSSPNASSNQDTVANFLRGWKIVIYNLGARGPLVLSSKSRLLLHVNEFLIFHQFLLTLTLFTRHTNQRIWYLNHFLSELKVALFWKGARYFLLFKEQTGKKELKNNDRPAKCYVLEMLFVWG